MNDLETMELFEGILQETFKKEEEFVSWNVWRALL